MTTYYLATTDPVAIATRPVGGHPLQRAVGDPASFSRGLPEGYVYIPDLPKPVFDPATQHAPVRAEPTLEGWGWMVRDRTPQEIAAREEFAAREAAVANLGAAFKAQLPVEYHGAFGKVFAAVRQLLDIGEPELARATILAEQVPASLVEVRAAMANLIPVPAS